MTDHAITTAADALQFLTAGNATVTLTSHATGTHFTFKAQKPTKTTEAGGKVRDHTADIVFVKGLHGSPDNWEDWHQLGFFFLDGTGRLLQSKKVRASGTPKSDSFKAFAWVLKHIAAGSLPDTVTIEHSGNCCRCGKTITHPTSLARGIGPECIKHF
jgi:hypothetical protein